MDWEWYDDSQTVHLFVHLLLKANHKPRKWRGKTVTRGQVITGLNVLGDETGISVQSLRTRLRRLELSGAICRKSTNKFSVITIPNYSKYQDKLEGLTINQQATNRQSTTNNNDNNDNNETKSGEKGEPARANEIPFESFWDLYDKKVGRPKAEKKWAGLSKKDRLAVMEYIPKYKAAQPEKRYRKHPTTFLNNRAWEDEIIKNGTGPELKSKGAKFINRELDDQYERL